MSNYSTLDKNILISIEGALGEKCEVAEVAYFWAKERNENDSMGYRAEEFAIEVGIINAALSWMIPMANKPHGASIEVLHDLKNYCLSRWCAYRFGGKKSFVKRHDLFNIVA